MPYALTLQRTERKAQMSDNIRSATALRAYAANLLRAAGLAPDRAEVVAEVLVEGDLMGHDTHGLAQLPGYLGALVNGSMTAAGEPEVVSDRGAAVLWDGRRLPGPWLVVQAIGLALDRARQHGTATVVIRRSHHIACLAAYLQRVTQHGMVLLLSSSDPSVASVAPHGGVRPLMTPNPIAAGFPTANKAGGDDGAEDSDPVLMDISTSTTTNGLTGRLRAAGRHLDHPWLIDAAGQPTRDPAALFTDPPGSILPLGGLDSGHKGYALGLLVEALTAGLGGFGRADPAEGWGAAVFLQVIDPAAFGGSAAFLRQTGWLSDAARATPPVPGGPPVRLPGARGLALRRQGLAEGLRLHPSILPALMPWAERLGVARLEAA
jgi:LDH2 family malate/lactate/ureidoglycolate dehydrogenase